MELAVSRRGISSRRATSPPRSQRRSRSRSRRSRARVECSSSPHSEIGWEGAEVGEGRVVVRPRPNERTCDTERGFGGGTPNES